jgi:hypothetical protein
VHAERLVHKLDTFTEKHRTAQTRVRGLIWDFYASLKAYRFKPSQRRSVALRARFDRILLHRTGFVTLDRLLARLHANKAELLMVLDRPEIPLHTNGSENDIRCYVTRRKVSAGTRSDVGRDGRDAFLEAALPPHAHPPCRPVRSLGRHAGNDIAMLVTTFGNPAPDAMLAVFREVCAGPGGRRR